MLVLNARSCGFDNGRASLAAAAVVAFWRGISGSGLILHHVLSQLVQKYARGRMMPAYLIKSDLGVASEEVFALLAAG